MTKNRIRQALPGVLLSLSLLMVTACTTPSSTYNVFLKPSNVSGALSKPNKNLIISVSDSTENQQFIGGSDSIKDYKFHGMIPWLQNRLNSINELDCLLTESTRVKITVIKLYATIESSVLVGTIVLNAKMTSKHSKYFTQHYRGDCKTGFFILNDEQGLQACFNSALDSIIPKMKRDICQNFKYENCGVGSEH